jgi:hypothetical protein
MTHQMLATVFKEPICIKCMLNLTRYHQVKTVVLLYRYGYSSSYKSRECLNVRHLEENDVKKINCFTIDFEDENTALNELREIIYVQNILILTNYTMC